MTDKNRPKTRKDRIMDAALRIFAEKGFQNASINEISKAAVFRKRQSTNTSH